MTGDGKKERVKGRSHRKRLASDVPVAKPNMEGNMNRSATRWRTITILVGVVVLLMVPFTASAKNPNPGILPPNASPNGSTYGEWNARWWQWALTQPTDKNPVLDPTGVHCAQGQTGPVWFLAGTFGSDPVVRECTVPAGKMLFFPISNIICVATEEGETSDTCAEDAAAYMDSVDVGGLAAKVDGIPIQQLDSYRVGGTAFPLTLHEDNLFGLPAGEYGAGADGFYLMLAPLSRGEHEIHFSAAGSLDVTYRITVKGK